MHPTKQITKLDLSVIQVMRAYKSELPLTQRTKDKYTFIGKKYNDYLSTNQISISAKSIDEFLKSKNLKWLMVLTLKANAR